MASHRVPAPVSVRFRAARTASMTLWPSLRRDRYGWVSPTGPMPM